MHALLKKELPARNTRTSQGVSLDQRAISLDATGISVVAKRRQMTENRFACPWTKIIVRVSKTGEKYGYREDERF
jgi:hypothetical protein